LLELVNFDEMLGKFPEPLLELFILGRDES
jgi:hypothetical protein